MAETIDEILARLRAGLSVPVQKNGFNYPPLEGESQRTSEAKFDAVGGKESDNCPPTGSPVCSAAEARRLPLKGGVIAPGSKSSSDCSIQLSPDQITSAVYVISPAQIDYIAQMFANDVANVLNMRTFAPRIRAIAERSLHKGLGAAKKMGKK